MSDANDKLDKVERKLDIVQRESQAMARDLAVVKTKLDSVEAEMVRVGARHDQMLTGISKGITTIGEQYATLLTKQDRAFPQIEENSKRIQAMEITRARLVGVVAALTTVAGMIAGVFRWVLEKVGLV